MLTSDDIVEICDTYTKYVGVINQAAAMRINDLCQTYPKENIIKAIMAAGRTGGSWRYIEATLENMDKETISQDPDKYTQGNYGHVVIRTPADLQRVMAMRKERNG